MNGRLMVNLAARRYHRRLSSADGLLGKMASWAGRNSAEMNEITNRDVTPGVLAVGRDLLMACNIEKMRNPHVFSIFYWSKADIIMLRLAEAIASVRYFTTEKRGT